MHERDRQLRFYLALLEAATLDNCPSVMDEAMRRYLRAANYGKDFPRCDFCNRELKSESFRHQACHVLSKLDIGVRL